MTDILSDEKASLALLSLSVGGTQPYRRIDCAFGEFRSSLLALLWTLQKDCCHPGICMWICDPPVPLIGSVGQHVQVEIVNPCLTPLLLHEPVEGIAMCLFCMHNIER